MSKVERERYYGRTGQFKEHPPRAWTVAEELFLIDHADQLTSLQLAVELRRTLKAIERKKARLRSSRV